MDIKSTSTITKAKEVSTSSSSSAASKDSTTNFKEELEAVKAQETKDAEKSKAAEAAKTAKNEETTKALLKEEEKNKTEENAENKKIQNPLNELNSKIAALNEFKTNYNSKIQGFDLTTDDNDYCKTIKMDKNDLTFFINLVDNQQMIAQSQANNSNTLNSGFTNIKSEATQQTVTVSATLLNSINESLKTNKPFRIDFGNDVAVIMRVDKEGVLSANFIPGSAAVENYLRNNIESLRQNFDNQNLPYNELSYRQEQKQEQNQKQNKENEDE